MGNPGQEGIDRFLETHKCNSICQRLGLEAPRRNPDGSWKSSDGLAKSRITVNSFQSSPSASSGWTARKYDDAVEAIKRVTKRKGSKDADDTSTLTQQQLSVLQSKLSMLIQQHGTPHPCMLIAISRHLASNNLIQTCHSLPFYGHVHSCLAISTGSMNQLLLSPQRQPRKAAPQADIKNRPWSPVRLQFRLMNALPLQYPSNVPCLDHRIHDEFKWDFVRIRS